MRLFDKVKNVAYIAIATLALGVVAMGGVDAQAKTVSESHTGKYVTYVGGKTNLTNVTNVKINGKKLSKMKKKVKSVQTAVMTRQFKVYSGVYGVTYYDPTVRTNEDQDDAKTENYKYITYYNYQMEFLKAGTYKISYDKYEDNINGDEKVVSADQGSVTTSKVCTKKHYVETYKVVAAPTPIKQISLGSTSHSYTYKRSGAKRVLTTVTKNRFLAGANGTLKFKTNPGYKITSAFAVTYDAEGNVVVAGAGNNANVVYSAGKKNAETKVKVRTSKTDEQGNVVDARDDKGEYITTEVTTKSSTTQYKETKIYYGYTDTFTDATTTFSVAQQPRTVYEWKDYEYVKDENGNDKRDENGEKIKLMTPVNATVITKTYLSRQLINNVYETVPVVEEYVVLAGAKSFDEQKSFYNDAAGKTNVRTSGKWNTVTINNVAPTRITAKGKEVTNEAYTRMKYTNSYVGSWVVVAKDQKIDAKTVGEMQTITDDQGNETYMAYVYQYDANGKKIKRASDTLHTSFGERTGSKTFYGK